MNLRPLLPVGMALALGLGACGRGNSAASTTVAPSTGRPSPTAATAPVDAAPVASPATTAPPGAASSRIRSVHTPAELTYDVSLRTGQCHARIINAGLGEVLPDPTCTPGAVDPAVSQSNIDSTICTAGYTSTVRPPSSQTDTFKALDLAAYGEAYASNIELDHLVPLELGGASSASNLWPEPNKVGAKSVDNPKDVVENQLHRAVCDGQMSLVQAQQAIATDWISAG